VSGGTSGAFYVVTAIRGLPFGSGGGVATQNTANSMALSESVISVIKETANDIISAVGNEVSRVINGSDPEGDRLVGLAQTPDSGYRFGTNGRTGNWAWRSITTSEGTFYLYDHLFNGRGNWDRVVYVPRNGSDPMTFHPGGFGGVNGYH
jgi:hypothetical protein